LRSVPYGVFKAAKTAHYATASTKLSGNCKSTKYDCEVIARIHIDYTYNLADSAKHAQHATFR